MHSRSRFLMFLLMLLLVAFAAGCDSGQPVVSPPAAVTPPAEKQPSSPPRPAAETMAVTVYYATKDAMFLVPEVHTVPKSDQPALVAVEQLLGAPQSSELVRTLPEGTKLKGITVKDHIAYVDFNDKLVKSGHGGSTGEILAVSAIVNTLTEFVDISKVQIMVDGKKIDTLYGHMDTSEPLSRSEKIIKKSL